MQESFYQHLSAFTSRLAFCFLLLAFTFLLFALSSCSLNPNLQTPGEDYLQGDWQQDSIKGQKALLNYSLYQLKFTCDSFYFAIKSYSKVNTGTDSCMRSGRWTEYIKGTYLQKNDTLHLKGLFCNQNWTIKNDKGCFRYGDYEEFFKVRKKTDSSVQFASTTTVIPIEARLIKKNTCHPKPI
jgi:hypothetical protein